MPNKRKTQDRRKVERRAGKRGVTVRIEDIHPDEVKRVRRSVFANRESEIANWRPIELAPKDGTWILLRGDSGYIERPYRVHVGRWDAVYRPLNPWQTSEACAFEDDGDSPTHWMPLP